MKDFIREKLDSIYKDFCITSEQCDGLCELKNFSFAGGGSPDYRIKIVRLYYLLKYFPAYLAEYYLMYRHLISMSFLPTNDIDIFSIGCGCGVDYWGFHFAAKERSEKFKETTSYTGYDANTWEHRTKLENQNVKFIVEDIGTLQNLDTGDYNYNLIVFPKSINDLTHDAFNSFIAAIENTNFTRKKIAIVCSFMLDARSQNYDFERLSTVINTMILKHGFECEDKQDEYTTMKNPEQGINSVVQEFVYPSEILAAINSIIDHCPTYKSNGLTCEQDCKQINQWPVLKQRYINYAVRRLSKDAK